MKLEIVFFLAPRPFDILFHFHHIPNSADEQAGIFSNVVTLNVFTFFFLLRTFEEELLKDDNFCHGGYVIMAVC